jgi:hypothetical protein
MKIELYSESFGVEKVDEVREYEEEWSLEEIIREVLIEKWGSVEEVIDGMEDVMGEKYRDLDSIIEDIIVEKESIDDGMGYRIDEERYLRIIKED